MTDTVEMRPRVYVQMAWLLEELGPDAPIYEGRPWKSWRFSPHKFLSEDRRCPAYTWVPSQKAYERCRKVGKPGYIRCFQHEMMWHGKFSRGNPRSPAVP